MSTIAGDPKKIPDDVEYYLEHVKDKVGPISFEQFQRDSLCIANLLLCRKAVADYSPDFDLEEVYKLSSTYLILSRFIKSDEYRPALSFMPSGRVISKMLN
jgi:hypothetical protein